MFEDEVKTGFDSGRSYAKEVGLGVDFESIHATFDELQEVVDEWPYHLSGPFVFVVSRVLGTAAAARASNDYAPIGRDQLVAYLAHSADILDSLKHV